MLNPSDVYVSGGTSDLLVCWTDKVTKYDASSFYNFEQDNLPLHDLDERTHLLWERMGHPTSSVAGMSFIVSGDATSSCNPQYFVDLSSCLEALPDVINYPILVEVASFGNLGDLKLSNKTFGPDGALEIVNRNSAFAGAVDLSNNPMTFDDIDNTVGYSLATTVSSIFDASAPSITFDLFNSFLFSTEDRTFIASTTNRFDDPRYAEKEQYVFTRRVGRDQLGVLTASLSSTHVPFDNTALDKASSGLLFDIYDKLYRSEAGDAMNSFDASTLNETDNTTVLFPPQNLTDGSDVEDVVAASLYFNHLNSIKISDCDGPIYIRNFTVDGQRSKEYGIEISNSNVNLERCSVSRCTKAGLYAMNSRVNLLRGFVAFRNYGFENGARVGTDYAIKREKYSVLDNYGAGIYAENSTIDFKSTYARDVDKSSEASSLIYTHTHFDKDLPVPSQENLYCLSRNDIGLHAINSNILGGRTELDGSATRAWQDAIQIFSELNTEAGARLNNCSLNLAGRFLLYGNYFGLDAYNSDVSFDYFKAYGNQKEGMKLDGCAFTYNNNVYAGYLGASLYNTARDDYFQHQVTLLHNGAAITANNSTISPVYASSMPDFYETFMISGTHGVYHEGINGVVTHDVKPNVHLNSSKLDAIHASIYPVANGTVAEACLGEAIAAKNGSKVYLRGSKNYANKVIGDNSGNAQHRRAGIYASENSTVSIQGPTVVAQFGVDVLVDNNSELEICPHRDDEGNTLASSFNLDDGSNHTMVELHSTRACLVADNGSVINLQDLGSYHDLWPNADGTYGPALDLTRLDYLKKGQAGTTDYVSSVSAGSLQFYPNAFINQADLPFKPDKTNLTAKHRNFDTGSYTPQPYYYIFDVPIAESDKLTQTSGVTTGGMCLRALNKSKVNVQNVHFPTGHVQTSAVIYDLSGTDDVGEANCSRTFIWNIADDSILKASYLSVSGKHPQDSGYVGPSGTWGNSQPFSGAPNSTPDTSSLSVLDYYGADGAGQNLFGTGSAKNYGAFRLYFSIDPLANYLVDPSSVVSGYVPQVFAQGYQFSGNLSAPGTVSAEYTKAQFSGVGHIPSSTGFHYASSMVHSPKTVKAVLDDSAMNSFANAKHNTANKSGLANVVTRYDPYDQLFGGDSTSDKGKGKGVASVNNFNLRKLN